MIRSIKRIMLQKSLDTVFKSVYNVQPGIVGRCIHNYVRPQILSMRKRREMYEKKNPTPKPPTHRNTFLDWNYNAELFAFGKRLSEDIEDSLLRQALTDKGYVNQERLRQEQVGLNVETFGLKDNEFMSQEGGVILEKHVNTTLTSEFPLFPQEGIQAVQEYVLSDKVLSGIASQIGLKDLIQCVEIPPTEEIFARAFRALISAVEKSSGHDHVNIFIQDFVVTHLCDKNVNEIWNIERPWSMLTDILSSKGETFEARLLREAGKNTLLSVFVVGLYTPEKKLIATGIGETVEIAQEMAARDGLCRIFGSQYPRPTFKFVQERSGTRNSSGSKSTTQLEARN